MTSILVTGASGLVGTGILRASKAFDYKIIGISSDFGDLTKEDVVAKLYATHKPDYVINCAAAVGGIGGNINNQGDFYYKNIMINTLMIHHAYLNKVKRIISMGSTCAFPDCCEVFAESMLFEGEPFPLHFAYAFTKRGIDIQNRAYNKQYGTNYTAIFPGNVFGVNDNYNIEKSHVVPCLINKIVMAKRNNTPFVVWGDGTARREFIFADDLGKIMLSIIANSKVPERLLVCSPVELTIKELVSRLVKAADFGGKIIWENILILHFSKPYFQILYLQISILL